MDNNNVFEKQLYLSRNGERDKRKTYHLWDW